MKLNTNMSKITSFHSNFNGYKVPFNNRHRTLCGCLYLVFILLDILPCSVMSISLAPVSWNSSNPISSGSQHIYQNTFTEFKLFKSSKNDHMINVKLYDEIDFLCPYYPTTESNHHRHQHHHQEYYVVYMVSKVEYDDCNIYSEPSALMVLNCSNPSQRKRFTLLFEPFQSIPNVPEYKANGTYYFMSTSTGKEEGLGNLYQGACGKYNMKLMVRICCTENSGRRNEKSDKKATDETNKLEKNQELDLLLRSKNNRRSKQIKDNEKDTNRVLSDAPINHHTSSISEEPTDQLMSKKHADDLLDKYLYSSLSSSDKAKQYDRESIREASQAQQQLFNSAADSKQTLNSLKRTSQLILFSFICVLVGNFAR